MKTNYCLPIIASTTQTVLDTLQQNSNDYEYCEIWLDYIEDLTTSFIVEVSKTYTDKLIFLFRRQNLEKETMDSTLRKEIVSILQDTQSFIDADIEHQPMLLAEIQHHALFSRLICSYHTYTHTPSDEILADIVKKMDTMHPMIYKISTFCQTPHDALRLLSLQLRLKSENKHCIILGMGEHGMITRIFGTLWGNEMIFAPLSEKGASAPGQLTKQQLETIFATLQKGGTD